MRLLILIEVICPVSDCTVIVPTGNITNSRISQHSRTSSNQQSRGESGQPHGVAADYTTERQKPSAVTERQRDDYA